MRAGYAKVLVPTDFSEWAKASVERCPEIPGIAEVVLLHVVPPAETPGAGDDGAAAGNRPPDRIRQQIERDGTFLEGQGIAVTARIEPSHGPGIARTILETAQSCHADLIVIGARGAGMLREALLGSVSHDVLRNAKCDVLIMHPRSRTHATDGSAAACPMLFSEILLPVDLSRVSEETVRTMRGLSGRSGITLFHAIPASVPSGERELVRARARDRLQALSQETGPHGRSSSVALADGDPVSACMAEADRANASLIVVSRYGRFDYMKNIPIGRTAEAIALRSARPVLVRHTDIRLDIVVRELSPDEFGLAEQVWQGYHRQTADRTADRIFAIFVEDVIAGVARCKRHPDGFEVDGVFVTEEFRDRGYARRLMQELIRERGHETLYMHAVLGLVAFYRGFGFVPIPEQELPQTIRERFGFAQGNMEGSDVCPMKREPSGAAF